MIVAREIDEVTQTIETTNKLDNPHGKRPNIAWFESIILYFGSCRPTPCVSHLNDMQIINTVHVCDMLCISCL
jgi:hypothetical protein